REQPARRSARARSDADARGRRGLGAGHRHRDDARVPAPRRPAAHDRRRRPRRAAAHRRAPGARAGPAVHAAAGAARQGRRRRAGPQDGAGLLHVVSAAGRQERGDSMTDAPVVTDRADAVATITLDDPGHRNALTRAAKEALRDAVAAAAADSRVRVVVLTGTARAFCLGQDLAEHAAALADGAEAAFATVREHYSPVVRDLLTMPKPVIAAVGGTCVGAGLGLALACDHRVFAEGVTLGAAFAGIGLTFDTGLSLTLP